MTGMKLRKPSAALRAILSSNIRDARARLGLSQEALADACGIHRTYIGSVERGERNISIGSLEIIANALGVTVPDILTPMRRQNHE